MLNGRSVLKILYLQACSSWTTICEESNSHMWATSLDVCLDILGRYLTISRCHFNADFLVSSKVFQVTSVPWKFRTTWFQPVPLCGLYRAASSLFCGHYSLGFLVIASSTYLLLLGIFFEWVLIDIVLDLYVATLLHGTFRTPNLKARLNTFREEFRAVWRNYSEL